MNKLSLLTAVFCCFTELSCVLFYKNNKYYLVVSFLMMLTFIASHLIKKISERTDPFFKLLIQSTYT